MNGVQLWNDLLSAYTHKAFGFWAHDKLVHNYKNFKSQKGESLDTNFIHFQNMEEELQLNGLRHESKETKHWAGQILIDMQNESLQQIAISISDSSRVKEWYDISLTKL